MQTQRKSKVGIKQKLTLFICLPVFILTVIGISLGYIFGVPIVRNLSIEESQNAADLLAGALARMINEEVEDTRVYIDSPFWKEIIAAANLKYGAMSTDEVKRIIVQIDAKWALTSENDPLIKQYLNNRLSQRLKLLEDDDSRLAEIFITDKYGGLIAASRKTSDFYQADEEWWQKAVEHQDKTYLGQIEFDESSGRFALPIAMAIKNEHGEIMGICKSAIDINILFANLEGFKLGKSGHAAVTDETGNILFHKALVPFSRKILNDRDFRALAEDKQRWLISDFDPEHHQAKVIITHARIESEVLKENGLVLHVFIDRAAKEVFAPLQRFIFLLSLIGTIITLLMIPVARIFAQIFTQPIHQLHLATEKLMAGNWDYDFAVKTGDEIEQFAETFQEMIATIKNKQNELLQAKEKLEDFSQNLEEKVRQRTEELEKTQEATLNILEDLTEAKHKAEEAFKAKSDFTSMVSHELRTPLTAIKEGIALVLDGATGAINAEQKQFLEIAKRNVDRLGRLINDVLDFQKLESGRMVFNFQENDINEVVAEVGNSMLPLAEEKGLEFSAEIEEGLPKIKFDRDKIIQVLANLVNNALKFTQKGAITIHTSKANNIIQVAVQDTGMGIKKEDLPKLFQKFTQLETGTERKTGGSGLGLAISKEIIEVHRGKIWAESEFGKGTTISFLLPIVERRRI
jgi:signal transduction histidine kinase